MKRWVVIFAVVAAIAIAGVSVWWLKFRAIDRGA